MVFLRGGVSSQDRYNLLECIHELSNTQSIIEVAQTHFTDSRGSIIVSLSVLREVVAGECSRPKPWSIAALFLRHGVHLSTNINFKQHLELRQR